MNFNVKKSENCFSDSETYEYLLPVTGRELIYFLNSWNIRKNENLRRPAAIAEKDGIIIKCVLEFNIIRVSFQEDGCPVIKQKFEAFLRSLP